MDMIDRTYGQAAYEAACTYATRTQGPNPWPSWAELTPKARVYWDEIGHAVSELAFERAAYGRSET